MKKVLLSVLMLVLVPIFFISCTSGPSFEDKLMFLITNWNSGPALSGAEVSIINAETGEQIGSGVSGDNGEALINVNETPEKINVKVTKDGNARSLVEGLKFEDVKESPLTIQVMPALLNSDPTTETDPEVTLDFVTADATETAIDITQPISDPFRVKVSVDAENHVSAIYEPLLGRIAGAGLVTTDRAYEGDATKASFDVSPTGFDGEVPIYSVVYDHNKNRVVKVEYLEIESQSASVTMYQPMPFTEFSNWMFMETLQLENIWSYTRRAGIALNNTPRGVDKIEPTNETMASRMIKNDAVWSLSEGSRVAPDGGNLWSHLYWTDWSTVKYYHDQGYLPNPGDRPEGYNLYRSLDGQTYQKVAFIQEDFLAYLADTITYYIGQGYSINQIMNMFPFYKDSSALLNPGVEMHYQVASVYGTQESTPTDLGSVVPLDSFNVELQNPEDETRDVSSRPNFRWRPTKTLESSEGTVWYNYSLFVYDWIQSNNGLIVPVNENGDMVNFRTDSPGSLVARFTGSATNDTWGCTWEWFNPYAGTIDDYTAETLEPNKTYGWGINIAYGLVKDADSRSYSIAADYKYRDTGWYIDPVGVMEPDLHADFTTGAQ